METLFLFLIMIVGIIFSAVISKYVPKIPLALIQISIGILMVLLPLNRELHFEPEIFMVCVIAPLVFYEGQKVSRKELWELKGPILLLAFGLVLLSVVLGGIVIHWLIPSMPLAISFALAAIISPTDTVALKSIVKNVKLPTNIMGVLEGESLINDAAGLVSFKVALGVALTGVFSVKEASVSFVVAAIGGVVLGAFIGVMFVKLRLRLRKMGLEESELLILIQLATPFVIYILAEKLEFSGILAVVAAGIVHGFEHDKLQKTTTKLKLVSNNVWSTLVYFLNSLVFLLLGSILPSVIQEIWDAADVHVLDLVLASILIISFLMFLRFIWVYVLYNHFVDPNYGSFEDYLAQLAGKKSVEKEPEISRFKYAFITTLAGVHGTISLATALSIPLILTNGEVFPLRNELLFITACVILISLVSATILLPLILPKEKNELMLVPILSEASAYQKVLQQTIVRLEQNRTDENHYVLNEIIMEIGSKLTEIETGYVRDENRKIIAEVLKTAQNEESRQINELLENNEISPMVQRLYQVYLENSRQFSETNFFKKVWFRLKMGLMKKRLKKMQKEKFTEQFTERFQARFHENSELIQEFTHSQRLITESVIGTIQKQITPENRKESLIVMERYNRRLKLAKLSSGISKNEVRSYASLALQLEREEIQRLLDVGEIDYATANQLGERVTYDELSELSIN